MHAEWIFAGGPVLSPHLGWTAAEAVAVSHGEVIAIGSEQDVRHTAGPLTRFVALDGRTVLPGLIDAHLHILGYALNLATLNVSGTRTLAAMQAAVKEQTMLRSDGDWIVGRGWDQDRWQERREPNSRDLDLVAPNHPVFLQRNCNHVAVANSAALRLAGIDRRTADPAGGHIDRDPITGEATGMLRETAQDMIRQVIPPVSADQRQALLVRVVREALSYGITQVHTDDVLTAGGLTEAESLFGSVIGPDALPLRVTQMIPMALLDEAAERGIRTGTGTEWYRYGQVKIFADGSLGGRTAALIEPYGDDPTTRGIFIHEEADFLAQVGRAHEHGNQVGCHCIGDAAAKLFIDAVEAAQRRYPRSDARHRMIHCQVLSERLMDRMYENGMIGDIQPIFLKSDGYWFEDRVGADRARTSYAWRSLLERGIPLCGGSDCPIEPLNIWLGIYAAVCRQDLDGFPPHGWNMPQRLSVAQTLDMYTAGASFATFEEGFKGSLQPGMAADLVVVDRDPFSCPPQTLKDVKAHLTMVDGRVAYEA